MQKGGLLLAPLLLVALGATARASIISIGSSLTYGGTNSPDTYSAGTTFSSTPVLVDGGAVEIWQSQVATGPNGEWDVFYMQTVGGGPLAGNVDADWNIVISYTLNAPAYFDAVANQFTVNGTPVSPLSNFGGICCATSSNPILPGEAYYNSGFSDPLSAGLQTDWQQIFINPYSFVSAGGIDPDTANGFAFALHFTLQQPTPEPASLSFLGAGLLGIAGLRRRR